MRKLSLCLCLLVLAILAHSPAGAAPATQPAPIVSIVKGDDIDAMVAEALQLIGGLRPIINEGNTVVIKPNLVTPKEVKVPGQMTDVRIVAALIAQIQKTAKCRIIIAEGSAIGPDDDPMGAFKGNGYLPLAKKFGVELRDLNNDEKVHIKLDNPLGVAEYEMPKTIMSADVLIDVPVMKTHLLTGVTIGMKNLFGLMPLPKGRFHAQIDGVLCDIIRMKRPALTLIDGITGTEGQGPLWGSPVKMNLVLAGTDIVAADSVASAVMGYEPARIRHLALAAKNGLGECDLKRIEVKGKRIDEVKRLFAYATWEAMVAYPRNDAAVRKALEMADRTGPLYRYRDEAGKVAQFNANRLKPDAAKYPLRRSLGFRIELADGGETIDLIAPYETVLEENGQSAVEEMMRWAAENLGMKEKATFAGMKPPTQ